MASPSSHRMGASSAASGSQHIKRLKGGSIECHFRVGKPSSSSSNPLSSPHPLHSPPRLASSTSSPLFHALAAASTASSTPLSSRSGVFFPQLVPRSLPASYADLAALEVAGSSPPIVYPPFLSASSLPFGVTGFSTPPLLPTTRTRTNSTDNVNIEDAEDEEDADNPLVIDTGENESAASTSQRTHPIPLQRSLLGGGGAEAADFPPYIPSFNAQPLAFQLDHPGSSSPSALKLIPTRTYSCQFCSLVTSNAKAFLHHQRDAHRQVLEIFECDKCDYATRYRQKLPRHMKAHEKREGSVVNGAVAAPGMIPSSPDGSLKSGEEEEDSMSPPPSQIYHGGAGIGVGQLSGVGGGLFGGDGGGAVSVASSSSLSL